MSEVIEKAYDYLDEIQAFMRGDLAEEQLNAMLISMANDGLAWKLTGDLARELQQRLDDGRIQGVIQNAWDEMNECVIESCFEKMYVSRDVAELMERLK